MAYSLYSLKNGDIRDFHAQLLYVTYSKFEHDWPSLLHSHPFPELCYITKGCGHYLIEGKTFPVKENDLIIINANVTHTEMSEDNVPMEYIVLGVDGLDFSLENNHEYFVFNLHQENSDFLFYMSILLTEMEQKKPDYELICQNLLEILMVKLARLTLLTVESVAPSKSSRACVKIKNYIDSNYTQEITLDTLSEISHLNKYYLAHAFSNQFGHSPISYLCEVRLQAAVELLLTTDLNITDIAHSSGFSSLSYFAQTFQKKYGTTASAYRKQMK